MKLDLSLSLPPAAWRMGEPSDGTVDLIGTMAGVFGPYTYGDGSVEPSGGESGGTEEELILLLML